MGSEFGQYLEWRYNDGLDWAELKDELNAKMKHFDQDLNSFYLNEPALWQLEQREDSVQIIDADNKDESVLSFIRQGKTRHDFLIVILNFTPVDRKKLQLVFHMLVNIVKSLIVPEKNMVAVGTKKSGENLKTQNNSFKNFNYQVQLDIPGFSAVILKPVDVHIKRRINRKTKTK